MAAPRTKLFVGHLPDGCTNEELQTLFERYGTVAECDVINKYGFVHMSSPEEAEEAIKGLNNSNFRGSSLSVVRSKSKLHPEPGAPGRARGVMPVMRGRGGYGGGDGPPRCGYRNGFNRSEGTPFESRGDFYPDRYGCGMGVRMRPYPSPYDRQSMRPLRDDYPYRSSPYSVGMSRDLYARPSASPRDMYKRRVAAYPSTNDYLSSRRSVPLQESSVNRGSSICSSDDRSSSSPEIIYQKINLRSHRERFPMDRSRARESHSSCSSDDRSRSSSEPRSTRRKKFRNYRERSAMDRYRAGERRSSNCSYDDRASSSESSSTRKKNLGSHREHSPMDRSLSATSKIVPERSARAREEERRSSNCSYDDRASSSPEPRYTRKKSPQVIGIDRSSSHPWKIRRSPSPGPSRKRESYPDQVPNYHDFMMAASKIVPQRSARAREKERNSSVCSSDDRSSSSPEPSYTRKKSPEVIGIDRRSSLPWKIRRSPSPGPSRKRESYPDEVPNYHDFMMAASKIVPECSVRTREKERCSSICSSDDRSSSSPEPSYSRKRESYPDQVTNYHDGKHAEDQETVVQLCHVAPTVGASKLKDLFTDFNVDFSKMRRRVMDSGAYTGDIRLTLASHNEAERAVRLLNGSYVDGTAIDMFIVE